MKVFYNIQGDIVQRSEQGSLKSCAMGSNPIIASNPRVAQLVEHHSDVVEDGRSTRSLRTNKPRVAQLVRASSLSDEGHVWFESRLEDKNKSTK